MAFQELGLIPQLLTALSEEGYRTPTPIQRGAIPPALKGRDVLGCAQTGTGKTCAFATPILQRLSGSRRRGFRPIRALILTPTRELAIQIHACFEAYGRHLPLRAAVIYGGVGQQPQVDKLKKGVDILVATPGRLLDLQGQGLLDLSYIGIFVLDEADRMLDMGFIHDVRQVIRLLPKQRQTMLFSATMPPEVMELVNTLMHNYLRVEADPVSSPVDAISQKVFFVDKGNKTKLLAHLIEDRAMDNVLVFSRTKHGANRIAQDLVKRGVKAAAIHGNKSQTARQQALADFKAGKLTALVATDIAARGLDIDELSWVINYDLPEVPETYIHRIGRTGRAGRGGTAFSFCRADEKAYLKGIEKLLHRQLPVAEAHPFPMVEPPTGVDPMTQARQEGKENARQKAREHRGTQQPSLPQKIAETAKGRRGTRRQKIEELLPSAPAQSFSDFVRPDPLASDRIMDATARLLTPRPSKASSEPSSAEGPARQPSGKPDAKQATDKSAAGRRKRKNPSAPRQESLCPPPKAVQQRHPRPRPIEQPLSRVKDSTEQPSLMKPYYLYDDD